MEKLHEQYSVFTISENASYTKNSTTFFLKRFKAYLDKLMEKLYEKQ